MTITFHFGLTPKVSVQPHCVCQKIVAAGNMYISIYIYYIIILYLRQFGWQQFSQDKKFAAKLWIDPL